MGAAMACALGRCISTVVVGSGGTILPVGVGALSGDQACLTWWFAHYPRSGLQERTRPFCPLGLTSQSLGNFQDPWELPGVVCFCGIVFLVDQVGLKT